MRTLKVIVAAAIAAASVWFIPVTARVIESLIRNAIMSFGTARNLTDVNVGLAKAILAVSLWLLLVALFGGPRSRATDGKSVEK